VKRKCLEENMVLEDREKICSMERIHRRVIKIEITDKRHRTPEGKMEIMSLC